MSERRSISKKIRFEVFKRDSFQCQYCGAFPPKVVLEIDHINPVSNGGLNDIDNLITSCFDCNRGKSDRLIEKVALSVAEKHEILLEKQEQIKAYEKLIKSIKAKNKRQVDKIENLFKQTFETYSFTESFRDSVSDFLKNLTYLEVFDAMKYACNKFTDPLQVTKYFCGICWNKIRSNHG